MNTPNPSRVTDEHVRRAHQLTQQTGRYHDPRRVAYLMIMGMSAERIEYKAKASCLDYKRCQRTSNHNLAFSNSVHIKNGSRCSRNAHYIINGSELCKMHAGEYLLSIAMGEI